MASFFFRNKQKSDVVKPANELLQKLWQSPTPSKVQYMVIEIKRLSLMFLQQVEDDLAKLLSQMKVMLQGTHGTSPFEGFNLVH